MLCLFFFEFEFDLSLFLAGSIVRLEEEIEAIVRENERKLAELRESYESRLRQAKLEGESMDTWEDERRKLEQEKQSEPHLSNLNFDEQLVGKIIYIIRPGANLVGKGDDCAIRLMGPSILEHHALISRTETGKVILEPANEDARILLNGDVVNHAVNLSHHDRCVSMLN